MSAPRPTYLKQLQELTLRPGFCRSLKTHSAPELRHAGHRDSKGEAGPAHLTFLPR